MQKKQNPASKAIPATEAPTAMPTMAPVLSPELGSEVGDEVAVAVWVVTLRVAVRSANCGVRVISADISGASNPVFGAVTVAPPVGLPPTTVTISVGKVYVDKLG